MQAGEVTKVIQVENAFTIVRLNKYVPAGKLKFADVKDRLQKQLQEKKTNQVRADLDKKLKQKAKIEVL
jgi:parvulin-like peptidyl-prolyl isomerase